MDTVFVIHNMYLVGCLRIKNIGYDVLKKDAFMEIKSALETYKSTKEDLFIYGVNSNSIDIIHNWTEAHREVIKQLLYKDELNIYNEKGLVLLFSDSEKELKTYLVQTLSNDIKRKLLFRIKSYMHALFDINMPSEAILIYEKITEVPSLYKLNKNEVIIKVQRYLDIVSENQK